MSSLNVEKVEVNGVKHVREDLANSAPDSGPKDIRIVVFQRGWVVIGKYSENGDDVKIEGASVIRKWGTTKGLGELVNGPLSDTVFDPCGVVKATKLGVCFTLDCEASKWPNIK